MQHSGYQPFTKRALVIAKQELLLASVLNFLYESGFDSIGALNSDEALRFFEEHDPHIVVISNYGDDASNVVFKKYFLNIKPSLTILEYSGGISALKLLIENINNT